MFWLSRPAYARWVLAAAVLVVGFVAEFRPPTTVPHPFAVEPIAIGSVIDDTVVRLRPVPVGLFDPVTLPMTATRAVLPGEPVLAATDGETPSVPDGWWAVTLDLPDGVGSGTRVRLALDDRTVDGVIVSATPGGYGGTTGLVAVPGEASAAVARSVREGGVVVLVGR